MAKISINDWQTIQSRKEIQGIKKIIRNEKAVNWSILLELFLLTVSFCLDNIFADSVNTNWLWILFSIIAFVAPILILFIMWISQKQKAEVLKQIRDTHELITMFDDELCYYVMTASSFYDSKIDLTIPALYDGDTSDYYTQNSNKVPLSSIELQKFYYIEASYYLNKSVNILCLMKNNIVNLIEQPNNPGSSYGQMISFFRFQNVILLMSTIYKGIMSTLKDQTEFASILADNNRYLERLNDFINECNRVLGTTISAI